MSYNYATDTLFLMAKHRKQSLKAIWIVKAFIFECPTETKAPSPPPHIYPKRIMMYRQQIWNTALAQGVYNIIWIPIFFSFRKTDYAAKCCKILLERTGDKIILE